MARVSANTKLNLVTVLTLLCSMLFTFFCYSLEDWKAKREQKEDRYDQLVVTRTQQIAELQQKTNSLQAFADEQKDYNRRISEKLDDLKNLLIDMRRASR